MIATLCNTAGTKGVVTTTTTTASNQQQPHVSERIILASTASGIMYPGARTYLRTLNDSNHHKLDTADVISDSKCRRVPHYRCKTFHRYTRTIDGRIMLHCRAQQRLRTPGFQFGLVRFVFIHSFIQCAAASSVAKHSTSMYDDNDWMRGREVKERKVFY